MNTTLAMLVSQVYFKLREFKKLPEFLRRNSLSIAMLRDADRIRSALTRT